MFQLISCRLCISICHNTHHRLYDEDGCRNDDVYALTEKYFAPLLLTLECGDNNAVICGECWRHISEFHTFQQSVLRAQKISIETVVKFEVDEQQDEEEFISIHPKLTKETRAHESFVKNEVIVKSEVEFMDYMNINENALRDREVSTFSQDCADEELEENVSADAEEYYKQENDITDSESDRLEGNYSSDDEVPLAVRSSQNDPKKQDSNTESSSITLGGNSYEITFQQEANVSQSDGSGGNSGSDDEAKRENPEENLMTELAAKSEATTKYRSHRRNLKKPKTIQDYDDLIAQWKSTLECEVCSESCTSYSLLQNHFERQHPHEKCHIICCQLKFYHRYELEKHIRFHTEPNAAKCAQCYTCFVDKAGLQAHLRRMHSGKPNDSEKGDLMKTNSANHDSQGHTCEECGKLYKTAFVLRRHKRRAHVLPQKIDIITCTICRKVYTDAQRFREHMTSHADNSLHACQFCEKGYKYRADLYVHLTKVHPKEWAEEKLEKAKLKEKKINKCEICEKVFKRSNNLREHLAKHKGKTLYSCAYCSRTFNYRTIFQNHVKREHSEQLPKTTTTHSAEKTDSCPFCEQTFMCRSDLYEHLNRDHAEEWQGTSAKKGKPKKIHKCVVCEKVFRRLQSLREHQARHEGKVLYSCAHCAKTFNYKTRLNQHLKKQHGEVRQQQKKD